MGGSEEQYRAASRFRDNLVDPSLNNQTYLGLQNQGFQNQVQNIDRMGDLRARSEETIPGALVNAYQSYHAGQDRARKQAEENQIMEQRSGIMQHQNYVNEGMPDVNEGQRIQNANAKTTGEGQEIFNKQQQGLLDEQNSSNAWRGQTNSSGLKNRESEYTAKLKNDMLAPRATQSGIDVNRMLATQSGDRLQMEKDEKERQRQAEDLDNMIIGIRSDKTLTPDQQEQKIYDLTHNAPGGKIPVAALPGIAAKAQMNASRAAKANQTAEDTALHLSVPYQDMKSKLAPVEKSLTSLEEIKRQLDLYKEHTRTIGQVPGLEDPIANTARENISNLADEVIPGYGNKLRQASAWSGVQTRMEDTVNDIERALTQKFKDAKATIDPKLANLNEVRAIEQKITALGQDTAKKESTLELPKPAAPSMADKINAPASGAPPRMVRGQFSPSAVGVPITNPNPVVRK